MRIGIDVTASIYEGTGVATYYQSLIPELLKIGSAHEFVLLGYALRLYPRLTLANKKLPLPPRLMEFLWNRLHVVPIETITGPLDVFHAWDYLQPPRRKTKIVTTIHDVTTIKFPMYHHPSTVQAQEHRLKWVRKEADLILTDSQTTKQDIIKLLGIEEERTRVIYLAAGRRFREFRVQSSLPAAATSEVLQAEEFRKREINSIKKKYGIDGRYFLSVGTQEPRKNIKRVVEAFRAFRQQSGDDQLVIVGRIGWGEQIAGEEGIKILGKISPGELPALYAGANALIYPSLYEGFGLPVLEAMTVGCPVVTSDRGSLEEIAGQAAALVDPEDGESILRGMETVMENRAVFINKGLKRSEKFSWEKTARETLDAYESVCR